MSVFYEVMAEGDSNFTTTLKEAMQTARDFAPHTAYVTVDRITIPRPTRNVILNILNGEKYVQSRESIAVFEDGEQIRRAS